MTSGTQSEAEHPEPQLLVADALGWQDLARCRGADDVFFDEAGQRARAFCNLCPVWKACLDFGLDEEFGVWGGLTPAERRRLIRLRRRLADSPNDPQNAKDTRRLVHFAGMGAARLAAVLEVPESTVEALGMQEALGPNTRREAS